MATITYADAGKRAVAEAMRADPSVWAVGEDLGRGGVFGQYKGLQDEFGPDRICDAPISEACIMGAAVGAAMMGTRPIVEMRFSDFALCAIDELVNQAAKARYMFGGQTRVPVTVREPIGMWRSSAAQHSQSLEAWYAHIPGLVVTVPSTPADNYGLLLSAIRSDDPVVHMEHKGLWPLEGEIADDADAIPFGVARKVQEGDAATVVSWSASVHDCAKAAETLADQGIAIDLLDLRTLWPWDRDAVEASVARTGRLIIVHEAVQAGGFGAEIAATIAERCHKFLKSPVRRLGAPRIPVSYAPGLEDRVRVTPDMIAAGIREMLGEAAKAA